MKLNKPTYLLICLIEECAEVIHRCCKAIRFGMLETQPEQDKSNQERLEDELVDLQAVVQLNQREDNLRSTGINSFDKCQNKMRKLQKYMEYSRQMGTLLEED